MNLSIIIPTFNEAKNIEKTLQSIFIEPDVEVIVVDGESEDNTLELAQKWGAKAVISPEKGKGQQMNFGATLATQDVLLFLHGDTCLPPNYKEIILNLLSDSRYIAGAFRLGIRGQDQRLRLVETLVNWRSQFLSLPYGDQGLFLKKTTFQQLGGFLPIPIMEDFEFIQRLRKTGKIALASQAIMTSDRRWQKLGVVKTTLINQLIILGYYGGISPRVLAKWYGQIT